MMPKKFALFLSAGLILTTLVFFSAANLQIPEMAAQTNTLSLDVVSARTEPDAPGGPVLVGDSVTEYEYIINVDNTGDPTQSADPGGGCLATDPGYPDSCDWPSIRAVPGAAPIYTQGNQDDFGPGVFMQPGKYLISVLADGYKMGGTHFTVEAGGTLPAVEVALQPHPLPAATVRIKVFEDISSVNGQFDAPAEQGLAGFRAVINDIGGEISADMFGNQLCSEYDASNNFTGTVTNCLISDANGDIVIPNVGSNRYDVIVIPPDGQTWIETTTLEGSPSWDTWLQEGGTGLDNEFVVAGEPFPWTIFGFVSPTDLINDTAVTGGVTGTLVSGSVYLPQQGALPYYGDIWNGFNGTKITHPISDGWVALSDLQNGDTAVYVGQTDTDGNFTINNVPDGNYLFTWWDEKIHHILDWMQVSVQNGEIYDMGTPILTGWFTELTGYVYNDLNSNGKRDPGEPGLAEYPLVIRDRDNSEIDRMSIASTTDEHGFYEFEKAYPMGSWMVLEAYNDRFYTTGITYQVQNQVDPDTGQPVSTTVLGDGVDVGFLPILGQGARIDWGVRPYEAGTNGGIVGSVFYDTTRAEYDPRFQAVEPWAPGIPGLQLNLWSTVECTDPNTQTCDDREDYQLAADGSYLKDERLNTTTTEVWEQPTGCIARDANGVPLPWGSPNQEVLPNPQPLEPGEAGSPRCLEGPLMGTQVQHGFASLDGNWGFTEGCFGLGGATSEGVCADGNDPESLSGATEYLVEIVIPQDDFGRDLYKVVQEEDLNVFDGDQIIPAVPEPACAGALHTVDVAGIAPDGPDAVSNPNFAAEGGSPYEGTDRPFCDVKLVSLANGKSIAPSFILFTEVPIPGKWKGYIIDDLTLATDPKSLSFGEKGGIPNSPIGIYDFNNRLITTIQSDPHGTFEVLLPSTHHVSSPTPSGVSPNVYYMLGNDPGQPGQLNPNYDPQFRTIGASFEIYPGLMVPSDLAPTQMVPGVIAAGSLFGTPPQCTINDPNNILTPELYAVSQPYITDNTGQTITIEGQGFGSAIGGMVTLNDVQSNQIEAVMNIVSWTDREIVASVPLGTDEAPYQLTITAVNGNSSVNGITFHVLDSGFNSDYNLSMYEVGPGYSYATIQSALDAAAASNRPHQSLVVVYPDTPVQWNPTGVYYENIIVHAPVKLQGIGPGGVREDASYALGSVIDGRGVAGDTQYAEDWRAAVQSLDWAGNQAIYEGSVIYVLAGLWGGGNHEFDIPFGQYQYNATIDGFTIQGGDQQGFPNQFAPIDPSVKDVAAVQGGGIFVNGYADLLQISNNVMQSNGGAYAGAIRLGTPHLPGAFNDNQNDNVQIVHNRILANGGTNLAGAIGIFSGSEGYEVAYNDICGNFSVEYGGGISHYGLSSGGEIHDNRIYFNRAYDEGGGIMIAGELPADFTVLSPGSGSVDIYDNLVQANLANDDGGGLRFLMSGNFPFNVYNNMFVNNVSTHEGGGVSLNDAPDVRFFNNTVMKNITTATAMTSNGSPAPAGLATSSNSATLQATLPGTAPIFSDPLMFNNIFWDNRAGQFTGATVLGIGLVDDPNPPYHWDMGVTDGSGLLSPTYTSMQVATGTNAGTGNIVGVTADPLVSDQYDTSVSVLPWRGNPRFVDIVMVTTSATQNYLGDYHLTGASPAIDAGTGIGAPAEDIDGETRTVHDIGADEYLP